MAKPTSRQRPNEPIVQAVERIPTVAARKTDEIVFAMVGPIASGVSYCSNILRELLQNEYQYSGQTIKLSDQINNAAHLVASTKIDRESPGRISKLQDVGNALRNNFGPRYLAESCIREISMKRGDPKGQPAPRRHFTILDSLKNPEEVSALREVYEDAFWLIGVFAPETVRTKRLEGGSLSGSQIADILQRDQAENFHHGQNVRATMELADFYVRNDGDNDTSARNAISRFLEVLFGVGVQTPTRDELAMQAATSISTGSACLSRQVGAVIINAQGEIIGQGMNDVPKFGGGLYSSDDGAEDHRCWRWKNKQCHNDHHKERLLSKIEINLADARALQKNAAPAIRSAVSQAGVKDLIEFSRSVHAEMEAIVSVARSGKTGLVGGTLYTKTFPCHNCARHIVASGIHRVIYIEPYAKSLALQLHDDSISVHNGDSGKKVLFLQYEGVAPRNIIRLFTKIGERKSNGQLSIRARYDASPLSKESLDGFTTREKLVVAALKQSETHQATEANNAKSETNTD